MCFISLLHTHTTYTHTYTHTVGFPPPLIQWHTTIWHGGHSFGGAVTQSVKARTLRRPNASRVRDERRTQKKKTTQRKKKKIFRLAFASNKILNTWQTCRYRHENNSSRSYSGECLNAAFAKGFFTLTPRWSVHSNTVRVTLPVSDWAADWLQSCYRIPFTG